MHASAELWRIGRQKRIALFALLLALFTLRPLMNSVIVHVVVEPATHAASSPTARTQHDSSVAMTAPRSTTSSPIHPISSKRNHRQESTSPDQPSNNNIFNGVHARAYEVYPHPFPCFPAEEDWLSRRTQYSPATRGFFFLKPVKVGSTTCSGVTLRISRSVAMRQWAGTASNNNTTMMCLNRHTHGPQKKRNVFGSVGARLFSHRNPAESYLWTLLRDPTKRMISQFFHFAVSRRGQDPTDENFLQYIADWWAERKDYYIGVLSLGVEVVDRTRHDPVHLANTILQGYNFIGVTERMNESVVVLSMLLNVPLTDVLHLSAKTSGTYDDLCVLVQKSFVSPVMQEFFDGPVWQDMIQYDRALYDAAQRSLDLTIDQLGRDRVEAKLRRFAMMQQVAEEQCLESTRFPCDANGQLNNITDCMTEDIACGMDCLDRVVEEYFSSDRDNELAL